MTDVEPQSLAINHDLVWRFFENDRAAGYDLYKLLSPKLLAIAQKRGVGVSDAHDVVQGAFARVVKHKDRYDRSRNFEAWISKITANVAIDFMEKQNRSRKIALDYQVEYARTTPENEPGSNVHQTQILQALAECVDGLSSESRRLLQLSKVMGDDSGALTILARHWGKPKSTMTGILKRIRESLLRCMLGKGFDGID